MTRILYFSTEWCGPCKSFKPVVQQVAQETGTSVQFIDADQHKDLATRYGVSSVPTIVIEAGGNVVNKLVGPQPKSALTNLFKNL